MNNDSADLSFESIHYAADTTGYSESGLSAIVRARAYELFEGRGCEPGHELDDWLQAEREIKHHLGL
jgi:hypothetical protein